MAKGHITFRPKDVSLLNFLRAEAQKATRSVNQQMEHFIKAIRDEKQAKDESEQKNGAITSTVSGQTIGLKT